MHKPIAFWEQTLQRLGLKRRRKASRRRTPSRQHHLESLEGRQLLTVVAVWPTSDTAEGSSTPGTIVFSRGSETSGDLTVTYLVYGTATNGTDYKDAATSQSLSGSITITDGNSQATLSILAVDDMDSEGDETVTLYPNAGSGFMIDNNSSGATVTIQDNDSSSSSSSTTVSVSKSVSSIDENGSTGATFTFTRSGDTTDSLQVFYSVNGTAVNGDDYTDSNSQSLSGSVVIPASQSSASISILPVDDSSVEGNETVDIWILSQSNYDAGSPSSDSVTIVDDESSSSSSSSSNTVTVSGGGSANESSSSGATFTITRAGDTSAALTVNFTIGGTADSQDFYIRGNGSGGSITIPVNESSATITVVPNDDFQDESGESVEISLSSSSNYSLGSPDYASITIVDDEDFTGSSSGASGAPMASNGNNCPCESQLPPNVPSVNSNTGSMAMGGQGGGSQGSQPYTAYGTDRNPHPIIAHNVTFDNAATTATAIEVELTFGGLTQASVFYDPASIVPNRPQRIAIQVDASTLDTGTYGWTMVVTEHYSGSSDVVRYFSGQQDIDNLLDSEFGNRWSSVGVDRLLLYYDGALWVTEGNSFWFSKNGSSYDRSLGEFDFSALAYDSGTSTYTITGSRGEVVTFDAAGLMTSRTDPSGNVTTYAYTDGDSDSVSDEIYTITDPGGRVTTFAYTSGLVSSITDFAGRVTTYSYTSGKLTTVTEPDPDGAGSLTAPQTTYTYDATTGLMASITNPEGEVTSFTYHADRTIDTITYPDGSTEIYDAVLRHGVLIPGASLGSSGNPADLLVTADIVGQFTDRAGETATFRLDHFGYLVEQEDALGNTTTYIRNGEGHVVAMYLPDPDGAGPLAPLSTHYHYDVKGNLVYQYNSDGASRRWTYDATWNRPLTFTDELGHQTIYTLDSGTGEILTERRVVGGVDGVGNSETDDVVTTFTYTDGAGTPPAGLLETITDALGIVTELAYNARGLVTSITYADGLALEASISFGYDSADNLTSFTDELGRVTTYAYDNLGRLISATLPDPDGAGIDKPLTSPVYQYAYDGADRLIKIIDPLSRITQYVYNAYGQLEEIITPDHDGDTNDTVTSFAYDAAGRMDEIIDALGWSHTTVFDELGRIIERHEPSPDGVSAGPVYKTSYGALGWVLSTTDPLNNVTNYVYENYGKKITTKPVDPATGTQNTGPASSVEYDAVGNLVTSTDALGRITTYDYDDLNRLIKVTAPDPTDDSVTNPLITEFAYDKLGNLRFVTDPLGNVTEYQYDARYRLVKVIQPDPDGVGGASAPETDYEYDDAGQLIGVTNALDHETLYGYDNLGRLILLTQPDPDGTGPLGVLYTSYTYDAVGNLTEVLDPLGNYTQYAYDDHNNLVEITLADPDDAGGLTSPVWTFTYDDLGNRLTVTDPLTRVTTYEYDRLNCLLKVTSPDPDGGGAQLAPWTIYTYDLAGNLLTMADRLSHTTTYAYDHLHRRTSVTNPNSEMTSFTYDAVGNLLSLTDPESNETTWVYDPLNRVIEETNELNKTRYFEYDNASNLVSKTDRNNRVTEYEYDNLHRLTAELWKDGLSTVRTLSFEYDAIGQLLAASDPSAAYDYVYDPLGRITEVTSNLAGMADDVVFTNVYDVVGNRTSLAAAIDGTDDFLSTYTYDDLYRLTRVTQAEQSGGNSVSDKRVDFAYNALGQWSSIARYASLDTSELVATTSYSYDLANRLTALTHQDNTPATFAGYDYAYDAANRITSIDSHLDGLSEYTYDNAGQLSAADHASQTDESYTYDDNGNRIGGDYDTDPNNLTVEDDDYTYGYDDEGNRVLRTDKTTGDYVQYTWDYRNRLTLVTFKNSSHATTKQVAYEYDTLDRRVRKRVDTDGNSGWDRGEQYIYDGAHIALQFDDSGSLERRNLFGPAVDQILASEFLGSPNETHWYLADHLGSVRDVYSYDNSTDTLTSEGHIEYDSFGNIVSGLAAATDAHFAYTGREWDADAELFYYRARWYDAGLGQFISQDPIGFLGKDFNIRRYVGNAPTMGSDPSGLANLWNPLSWDLTSAPGQTWLGFVNPVSEENIATLGGGAQGVGHGSAMIANAATFHQIESLDTYVDDLVETHGGAYGVANASAHVGVYAGYAATGVWAWSAAGLPTFGAGVVTTSETSILFQVSGQTYMGTSAGLYNVSGATWATFGYWTSITGVPILSADAALVGAGGTLWFANHPCASRALQAFVNGFAFWR